MNTKIAINWFLLGFMSLFLGLGPAGHYADFLGLHDHSSHHHSHANCSHSAYALQADVVEPVGSEPIGSDVDDASQRTCSCDHHDAATDLTDAIVGIQLQAPLVGQTTSGRNSTCQFCKFFEDFHVIVFSWDADFQCVFSAPNRHYVTESVKLLPANPIARGPPTVS